MTVSRGWIKAIEADDKLAAKILKAIDGLKGSSVFIKFITEAAGGTPSSDALLGAIWTSIGWSQLMNKRISKVNAYRV